MRRRIPEPTHSKLFFRPRRYIGHTGLMRRSATRLKCFIIRRLNPGSTFGYSAFSSTIWSLNNALNRVRPTHLLRGLMGSPRGHSATTRLRREHVLTEPNGKPTLGGPPGHRRKYVA